MVLAEPAGNDLAPAEGEQDAGAGKEEAIPTREQPEQRRG